MSDPEALTRGHGSARVLRVLEGAHAEASRHSHELIARTPRTLAEPLPLNHEHPRLMARDQFASVEELEPLILCSDPERARREIITLPRLTSHEARERTPVRASEHARGHARSTPARTYDGGERIRVRTH